MLSFFSLGGYACFQLQTDVQFLLDNSVTPMYDMRVVNSLVFKWHTNMCESELHSGLRRSAPVTTRVHCGHQTTLNIRNHPPAYMDQPIVRPKRNSDGTATEELCNKYSNPTIVTFSRSTDWITTRDLLEIFNHYGKQLTGFPFYL